ncbi:hypothetical protein CCHL11_04017 [Colletotrichum chlorophyti]|uniref:DEUBAD domain-containing protein n=1 Tax=Colletotrichum chlorophyti TaxID=708187 RepID=A0A1Q8RKV6_9PEZI|nr:hypothetical protein CCHL11_04017 [Colletotrichum chlorophyti]
MTTSKSMDVEMADADELTSVSSVLSPPSGSDYEGDARRARGSSPNNQLTSLESISLERTITGTEIGTMARRSARNTNKSKPVFTTTSPKRPSKRKIVAKSVAKKTPKWTAEKLLTDSKSPLASADLRKILCQPAAWEVLSPDERAEIMALLPAGTRIIGSGTDDTHPDFDALRNDDNFRHDCATYTDNITQGKHDPEWLDQAWAAHQRRKAGDFDAYLAQKFEDEWSCELPEDFKPKRQRSTASASVADEREGDGQTMKGKENATKEAGTVLANNAGEETSEKDVQMEEADEEVTRATVVILGSPVPETKQGRGGEAEVETKADVDGYQPRHADGPSVESKTQTNVNDNQLPSPGYQEANAKTQMNLDGT